MAHFNLFATTLSKYEGWIGMYSLHAVPFGTSLVWYALWSTITARTVFLRLLTRTVRLEIVECEFHQSILAVHQLLSISYSLLAGSKFKAGHKLCDFY